MDRGREPLVVLQNLAGFYLNLLIAKTAPERSDLVAVTSTTWDDLCIEAKQWQTETILRGQQKLKESEVQLKNTTQPRLWLEVTLLGLLPDACTPEVIIQSSTISTKTNSYSEHKVTTSPTQNIQSKVVENSQNKKIEPISQPNSLITKPPETAINNDDLNLEEIWQLVLDKLPLLSSALIKQHGYLINYKDTVATVGIKTQKLLKTAQSKLPQIESAFQTVVGHKVKVNLQVGNTSKTSQKSHDSTITSPSVISQTHQTNSPKKSENLDNDTQNNLNSKPILTTETDNNDQEESEEILGNSPISTTPNSLTDAEISEDKIKQAANQFAKFFKGEIITDNENFIQEENNLLTHKSNSDNSLGILDASMHELNSEQKIDANMNNNHLDEQPHKTSINSKKVIGRPEITNNEEELEF